MTRLVTADRTKEVKTRVFRAIKLYSDFHGERRKHDELIINTIETK